MKCQIRWIDRNGKPTGDENEAVAMAHYHKAIWLCPAGCIDNRIVGYRDEIDSSHPICAEHLAMAKPGLKGWSFTPLNKPKGQDQ
jgi:hypothetical protein